MDVFNAEQVQAFVTKDGSEIRELLAYRNSCIRNQSLAEARVHPGQTTTPHKHPKAEEIYHILEGQGLMTIEMDEKVVGPGDAIAIPPGSRHTITTTEQGMLRFLYCCAPPYEHENTNLEE